MILRPSVLCPIDFSASSRGALRYAGVIAAHFAARLTLHSSPVLGPRMGSVTYRVLCLSHRLVLAVPPVPVASTVLESTEAHALAEETVRPEEKLVPVDEPAAA
jgi:hypothetical protein